MKVRSIFRSLDGEANGYENSGQPSTFIRLQGCNLQCKWCDTAYAQDDLTSEGFKEMSVDEIIGEVEGQKVTVTGGEPTLRSKVSSLIARLIQGHKDVTVETNGSIPLINHGLCYFPRNKNFEHGSVRFVVDYKLPSSGMEHHMVLDQNVQVLQPEDVVKFVVADENDLSRMVQVYQEYWWNLNCKAKVVISPAITVTSMGPDLRWATILAEKVANQLSLKIRGPGVLFSLQIHKVLWPNANAENER